MMQTLQCSFAETFNWKLLSIFLAPNQSFHLSCIITSCSARPQRWWMFWNDVNSVLWNVLRKESTTSLISSRRWLWNACKLKWNFEVGCASNKRPEMRSMPFLTKKFYFCMDVSGKQFEELCKTYHSELYYLSMETKT